MSTKLTSDEITTIRVALLKWKFEVKQSIEQGTGNDYSHAILRQLIALRHKLFQMRSEVEGNAE